MLSAGGHGSLLLQIEKSELGPSGGEKGITTL